jgi:hypothetical protein
MSQQTFDEFTKQMQNILAPTAAGKGYNTTGIDGINALYEFVQSFAGDGHALGEIVYKAKRYAAKGDPTELVKIASWAFLVWRHRQAEKTETMREFVEALFPDPIEPVADLFMTPDPLEPVEDAPEIPLPPKNFGRPMNPRVEDVVGAVV